MLLNVTVDTTRDAATLLPSTSLTGPPGRTRSRLSRRAPARSRVRLRTARHRVSVVESGGKIRYHARARSRGGREIDVSAGQRVLVASGVSPRGDKSGSGLSPRGCKTVSVCAPGAHFGGRGLGGRDADCACGAQTAWLGRVDVSLVERGEKSPPGDNDTRKVHLGNRKVQEGHNPVGCGHHLLIMRSGVPG